MRGGVFWLAAALACGAASDACGQVAVIGDERAPLEGVTALQADRVDRKLYVGALARDPRRTSLLVFDLDDEGRPVGRPRRYSDHPATLPSGQHSSIVCFLHDRVRRRLYWGVRTSDASERRTLVTMKLDAAGEPTGSPEAFDTGNPNRACDALAAHPKNDRLYAVGWGGEGVYAIERDADGRPTGTPAFFRTGGQGGAAVAVRADGSKLYRGTYPSVLETVDLDARGDLVGAPRTVKIVDGPQEYLRFVATSQSLYYRGAAGRLSWFPLDASGEPARETRSAETPGLQAFAVGETPDRLLAAYGSTFVDATDGRTVVDGVRLFDLPLRSDGAPGSPVPRATVLRRVEAVQLSGGTSPALAVRSLGRGFLGDRISGLQLRATLLALETEGAPLPAASTVSLGAQTAYLRFVVSERFQKCYAVADERIVGATVHPAAAPRVESVACAGASGPIAVDDRRGVVYAALGDGRIARRTLDARGVPTAQGGELRSGLASIGALAVHDGSGVVLAIGAARDGAEGKVVDEGVTAVAAGPHTADAAVDSVRGRLYVAGGYDGQANLSVWRLDSAGRLADDSPKKHPDGVPGLAPTIRSLLSSVRLHPSGRKLYVAAAQENPPEGRPGYVVVHDLDEQGDPTGKYRALPSANGRGSCWAVEISPDGRTLYESGWGESKLFVRTVDERGEPSAESTVWNVGGHGKRQLATAIGGKFLLAGAYPSVLETIPLRGGAEPEPGAEAVITAGKLRQSAGLLAVGASTPWIDLDPALHGGVGAEVVRCTLSGSAVRRAVLRWEVVRRQGDVVTPLRTVELTIAGDVGALIVPKYGLDDPERLVEQIRTSAEEYSRYRDWARKHGLSPNERPQRLLVANGLIGLDSSPEALDAGAETLALLGHNGVQAWNWSAIAPGTLRSTIERHGIKRFRDATYTPPSYFHYHVDQVRPEFLDRWAAGFRDASVARGAKPEEVELFHMADEPGWYFPGCLEELRADPRRLAVFRDYLRAKGMTPEQLGATSWEQVVPGRLSGPRTLEGKRLLYWTARFYTESLSLSFRAATESLQRQVNPQILTTTNLNNWPGRYFIPSPGQKIANNADSGPDSAMGMPDWFDLGRKRAVTCIWTEDWFGDQEAQLWSLYGDLLRCAAREGGVEYGGYAVGHSTGAFPEGAAYKILSLVGHGAKVIDPYTFGPHLAFADGWSENEAVYRNLAKAMRRLAKGERLLAPGRPTDSEVAILFPQASQVWDANARPSAYLQELYGLHAALIHDGYAVDFLDDYAVETGALTTRKYSTLYITAPNLSVKAQRAVMRWVEAGGTVALSPGAAAADEYDEPVRELREAIGASQPVVPRVEPPHFTQAAGVERRSVESVEGSDFGAAGATALSQVAPLAPTSARTLAKFDDGGAAAVERAVERGRVVAYGYWPGVSYWLSPDRSDRSSLPTDWSAGARRAAGYPARAARALKQVETSVAGVEARRLDSPQGTAVVLLNWSGAPIPRLTVTTPKTRGRRVESVERGMLTSEPSGDGVRVDLSLESVDVLLIEP